MIYVMQHTIKILHLVNTDFMHTSSYTKVNCTCIKVISFRNSVSSGCLQKLYSLYISYLTQHLKQLRQRLGELNCSHNCVEKLQQEE
jgi:hypothetical protein